MIQPGPIFARLGLYLCLAAGALFSGFPFLWMVMTSLKPRSEATHLPPTLLPQHWDFQNYVAAWQSALFGRYFFNTFLVATCVVVGVLITATLAAYAFARLDFPGRNVLFALFISTLMIPFEATLIPNFIIIKNFGWYNTYLALIVPWTANVFSVFLLRQFFITMPQDLFDAAMLDGAGLFRLVSRAATRAGSTGSDNAVCIPGKLEQPLYGR